MPQIEFFPWLNIGGVHIVYLSGSPEMLAALSSNIALQVVKCRMFIFCFVAKAESSLVKESSDVSGMEHVGGPVVFPHLAVNFKQKMKESSLYLSYVCHNSYLYHKNDLQVLLLSLSK